MIAITKGNILLEIPLAFSLSQNPRINLFGLVVEVIPSFLLTIINSTISLLIVPLDGMLDLGSPRL